MRRPDTVSKSLSRAVRKMIGSAADSARSSRHSAEAAVDLVAQADVEQHQVRQPRLSAAVADLRSRERAYLVAVLFQHVRVVRADRGVVLDDCNGAGHGRHYSQTRREERQQPHTASALPFFVPSHVRIGWFNGGMKTASHVSTRQVLNDFAVACALALGIGATVGLAAAGFVSFLAWINA